MSDILFDELLSELSGAELKVVLYIIRRTFGFKRQTDTISLNQMLSGITKKSGEALDKGTGLSKPALLKALRSLSEQGIILQTRKYDRKGGNMPTEYRLHIAAEPPRQRGDETPSKELLPSPLGKKVILKTLSEIKSDGADQPARVFSHRMKLWAEKQFSKQHNTNFRATISQFAQNI